MFNNAMNIHAYILSSFISECKFKAMRKIYTDFVTSVVNVVMACRGSNAERYTLVGWRSGWHCACSVFTFCNNFKMIKCSLINLTSCS